jgi:beta-glucosidase/6-phospho-beta-glucosidase/beta-galactosidase
MFTTGIENSYPKVGDRRVDEMELCGHYSRWKEDLCLTKQLGIDYLRIGPAYYMIHEAPGRYRWELFDEVVQEMQRLSIEPIVDLLHFGLPDWMGNFQNPEFPGFFAEYAHAFARRYPHIRFYTPINEILITAKFSAKYGWWNEQLTSDLAYVTALKHLIKANLLAMQGIRLCRADSIFVQTESLEYWHTDSPSMHDRVELENQLKFVPFDFTTGLVPGPAASAYLSDNGFTREDFYFAASHAVNKGCIMGADYYMNSEHTILADGTEAPSTDTLGLVELCRSYYNRYSLPIMHTETNMGTDRAVNWLRKQWMGVLRLIDTGVPVTGFTWFSLTDQMDWDTTLREANGHVGQVGLADLDRKLRPVGEYYKYLIDNWKDRLLLSCITPAQASERLKAGN